MKINIKPVTLELQKPIKVHHYFLELATDYLVFSYDMLAKEPINPDDPDMGWDQRKSVSETIMYKKHVGGTEMYILDWDEEGERWGFAILGVGLNDVKMYFEKKEEALAMKKAVFDWLK